MLIQKYKFVILDKDTQEYSFANRKPKSSRYENRYEKYSMMLMFGSMLGYQNCEDEYSESQATILMLKMFKKELRKAKRELKETLVDRSKNTNVNVLTKLDYYISVREEMIANYTNQIKIWTAKATLAKASSEYLIETLLK
jgi:hypothetical protein